MRMIWKFKQLLQRDGHDFVAECYRELLNREPDPGGLQHHLHLLQSGVPKVSILLGIMKSGEAIHLYHQPPE